MARMFGTDGVRGVAGSELTIELAKIACANEDAARESQGECWRAR